VGLYRFKIFPESPWLTPWQSDTLAGMLCWSCARTRGGEFLRRELLEPALAGKPRFVLSDAFPGDCLPFPVALRLQNWPADQRKSVKRTRWISTEAFRKLQCGAPLALTDLITTNGTQHYSQLRNTLARQTNTTSERGSLFSREEWVLERGIFNLTLYVRLEPGFEGLFEDLLRELAQSGFGADVSAGKGQFRLDSKIESVDWLDKSPSTGGCTILSTFQPGTDDSTEGYWESFTKYGKLGPDFGVDEVFKRPLLMLRAGACFNGLPEMGRLGRCIPMEELLAPAAVAHFSEHGMRLAHLAFGLAVPMPWQSIMNLQPATVSPIARESGEETTALTPSARLEPDDSAKPERQNEDQLSRDIATQPRSSLISPPPTDKTLPEPGSSAGTVRGKSGWYSPRKEIAPSPKERLETVTLLESVRANGNAQVQTEAGETILCRNFPSFPKLSQGEQVRAEITRLPGQTPRAVFKKRL